MASLSQFASPFLAKQNPRPWRPWTCLALSALEATVTCVQFRLGIPKTTTACLQWHPPLSLQLSDPQQVTSTPPPPKKNWKEREGLEHIPVIQSTHASYILRHTYICTVGYPCAWEMLSLNVPGPSCRLLSVFLCVRSFCLCVRVLNDGCLQFARVMHHPPGFGSAPSGNDESLVWERGSQARSRSMWRWTLSQCPTHSCANSWACFLNKAKPR